MAASNQDIQLILQQHGEKISLGVALVVAAYFLFLSGGGDASSSNDDIKRHAAAITAKQGKGIPADKKPKVPNPLEELTSDWEPVKSEFGDLPWVLHRVPNVKITSQKGPDPLIVTELSTISAKATRDNIAVNWAGPPSTGEDPDQKGRQLGRARLMGFILEKWAQGLEDKKRIIHRSPGSTSYTDKNFQPKTTYFYRVRAYYEFKRTGDERKVPEIKGGEVGVLENTGGPNDGAKVRFTKWTPKATATTALNISLTYRGQLGPKATIYVWQFWNGDWWRMRFQTPIGGDIGGMVSALELIKDPFNKNNRSGSSKFPDLVNESKGADKDKKKFAWASGIAYIGNEYKRIDKRRTRVAHLEHQEIPMRGFAGIDWGTKYEEVPQSAKEEPPN